MSLLKLNDQKYRFIRYASSNVLNKEIESLCINHFKIEFIGDDNSHFINTLHKKCDQAGMLRQFGKREDTLNEIKDGRIRELKQNIIRQHKLLSDFERKLDTETDPRAIMRYEDEIEEIKMRIAQYEKDIES